MAEKWCACVSLVTPYRAETRADLCLVMVHGTIVAVTALLLLLVLLAVSEWIEPGT